MDEPVVRSRYADSRLRVVDHDMGRVTGGDRRLRYRREVDVVHARGERRAAAADRVHGHADDQNFGCDQHHNDRGARH